MTNRSDLSKCMSKLEVLKELTVNEEITAKIVLLEEKERLLKKFSPRDYERILKGLESGAIIRPGDWIKEEKKIETPIEVPEEPKIDEEKLRLEKELQITKDKLAELEVKRI